MQLVAKKNRAGLNSNSRTPIENSRNCLIRFRNSDFFSYVWVLIYLSIKFQLQNFIMLEDQLEERSPKMSILGDFQKSRKRTPNRPELRSRPPPTDFSTSLALLYWSTNRLRYKHFFAENLVARAGQFALRVPSGGNQVDGLPPDSSYSAAGTNGPRAGPGKLIIFRGFSTRSPSCRITRRAIFIVSESNSDAPGD